MFQLSIAIDYSYSGAAVSAYFKLCVVFMILLNM